MEVWEPCPTTSEWSTILLPTKVRLILETLRYMQLSHFPRYRSQFFSCDQAAIWLVQSVCLSVCLSVCPSVLPSVCHTFFTMFPSSYHHEIFRSYYQWQKWRPCKRSRSKVKVTEVNTQLNRFRTVTLVWIHIWWWNDAYSLMMLRRGALLFFKVIRQISRSHGSKKRQIWPRLGVSGL